MTTLRHLPLLVCLPLALSAQAPVGSAVRQIAAVLRTDGHVSGPVIVAAMSNCQRVLADPTCTGAEYTEAGRRAAFDVATLLGAAVLVPASADLAAARERLVVPRNEVGTPETCDAEGNVVRTLLTTAPVMQGDGRQFRIGVTVQQLPLLSGCRASARLYEYSFEVPDGGGDPKLTGYRLLLSGTGIPSVDR